MSGLDHIESFFLEQPDDAFGKARTDAFDHARTEIALDPGHRGRQGLFANLSLELRPVFWMVVPLSLQAQVFPRREFR